MSNRTIPFLGAGALGLVALYIALVVTTVFYAAWQTDLAASMRSTESHIATLESAYYTAIATLGATDPASYGLVTPAHVEYAVRVAGPVLTLR